MGISFKMGEAAASSHRFSACQSAKAVKATMAHTGTRASTPKKPSQAKKMDGAQARIASRTRLNGLADSSPKASDDSDE